MKIKSWEELTDDEMRLLVRVSKAFLNTMMKDYKWDVEPTMLFADRFFANFRNELRKPISRGDVTSIFRRINRVE